MSGNSSSSQFKHAGVRALVELHETHLREFLAVWREFVDSDAQLPTTEDPDYASVATLLRHVLGCARHYLEWICTKLQLAQPGTRPTPPEEDLVHEATSYAEHLFACWREALTELTHKDCDLLAFSSAWGAPYCIDAMLEHAVMHPIRHSYQLRALLKKKL